MYKVKGIIREKEYISRKKFDSDKDALKFGYGKVYNPSGNTKRKNGLRDLKVIKV